MKSSDPLVGLRVQITIEEDGTSAPVSLPTGTIIKKMTGTDTEEYYVVRLDRPVRSNRAKTSEKWELTELAILPHFAGVSMKRLVSRPEAGFDFVHVRIVKPPVPLGPEDSLLDLSKSAYFALGTVKRV